MAQKESRLDTLMAAARTEVMGKIPAQLSANTIMAILEEMKREIETKKDAPQPHTIESEAQDHVPGAGYTGTIS